MLTPAQEQKIRDLDETIAHHLRELTKAWLQVKEIEAQAVFVTPPIFAQVTKENRHLYMTTNELAARYKQPYWRAQYWLIDVFPDAKQGKRPFYRLESVAHLFEAAAPTDEKTDA